MRQYEIQVRGFDGLYYVDAKSPAQARYKCWREAREAGYFLKTNLAEFASVHVRSVKLSTPAPVESN